MLQPGHDAEDLLGLMQPKLVRGDLAFEETSLGSPGLYKVAEQRHETAGGCEVPGPQGSSAGCSNGQSRGWVTAITSAHGSGIHEGAFGFVDHLVGEAPLVVDQASP